MAFEYADNTLATPLLRAIVNNDRTKVHIALKQGFSPNLGDNRGWTPLHLAACHDERSSCVEELLNNHSILIDSLTFEGETPLFLACQNGCVEIVDLLLKRRCDVNKLNSEFVSPLHVSCSKGNLQIVKKLVEFGAKVNAQDANGYTTLHEAVASGNRSNDQNEISYKICKYLLSHGATHDITDYEGNYPFHIACQNGLTRSAKLLMKTSKHHNIVNMCNVDGRSALMMAVQSQNQDLVEMLLSHDANPNISAKRNIIALHIAAHTAKFQLFNLVLKATSKECLLKYCTFNEESDFEKVFTNKHIHSIICLAIDTDDLIFLKQVLESGLDQAVLRCPVVHSENLAKKSFTLHTPISFLLESKMYELGERTLDFLQTLIDYGSPLKVMSKSVVINYVNPLCAALVALNDCPVPLVLRCLRVLLTNGANPDEPPGRMPFPMEQACMRGCAEAVLLLLQYSNILEPDNVIRWIELETSSNQEKIVEVLLPLAPGYSPSDKLLPDVETIKRRELLAPRIHSLTSFCRTVIRKQIHKDTQHAPHLFTKHISSLPIPKDLCHYLRFM